MSNILETTAASPSRKRTAWRQRLVDAERGFTYGMRSDGTLFVYLFLNSIVLLFGLVLQIGHLQWLVVLLTVAFVLAFELMHQAIRHLVTTLRQIHPSKAWDRVLHLATAAVVLAFCSGSVVVTLIYWQRIREMFAR